MQKSRMAVKALGSTLKQNLMMAMKEGGPLNAIKFCNANAMPITEKIQKETGVKVSRTSLKYRNADNMPDPWESKVLAEFAKRGASGEAYKTMDFSEVVEADGKRTFRYMKALPAAEPCVICHGDNIAPDLQAKIDELYPEDKATGFKIGDLRGAFSVKLDL